ncbi:MAG: class IIb bacteriocin, lactobin A/cerein 7B family [Leuconostoc mesenteroides]
MLDIKQRKMDSFKNLDHSELSEVVGGVVPIIVGGAVVLKVAAGMGGWIYYWIRAHKEKVR